MIIRLINAVRGAILWASAVGLCSDGRCEEALEKILFIEDKRMPLSESYGEFQLFKGFLLYAVNRLSEAIEVMQDLHSRIDDLKGHSDTVKEYMKCYSECIINGAVKHSGRTDVPPFDIDFKKVDLEKVPQHWKTCHPLWHHPDWVDERN